MAKKNAAADAADDLLGGAPSDDLLAGEAKPKGKAKAAKPAAKVAKPVAKAAKPAAKAAPAAKAPKADAAPRARGVKGSGKFAFPAEELAALKKQVGTLKKETSTKEIAEKFDVPTWRARLACASLVNHDKKGTLTKIGSVLVYKP